MIKKSDFKVGGRFLGERRRNDPFGVHFTSGDETYRYRVPIGRDDEGDLTYSDYDREVVGRDWIYPGEIYRRANAKDIVSREEYNDMMMNNDFPAEEYGKRMRDAKEQAAIRQIGNTASHEAGHSAHDLTDPERMNYDWQELQANRQRGGYGLFNTNSNSDEKSVAEFVAYMSEYPHESLKFRQGMKSHPDVGDRYVKRIRDANIDANESSRTKRNLINAILDQTATTGKRTGAGNFQFGDIDDARNRKKQAERTSRALIRQIQKLPDEGIEGFGDLPQDIQEGIGRLQLRDELSQYMDNNFETARQATLNTMLSDPDSLDFAIANPEMFFENYDSVPVDWVKGKNRWDDYILGNDALSTIPPYGYDENPELLEALKERFGEPTGSFRQQGWGLKPKVKSNPYMRTPWHYYDPKFGSDALLDDIINQYGLAEDRGVDFDSSRAFMKSWGLMKAQPFSGKFPAKYSGNCKVCGRLIKPGEEVMYNRMLGGVSCPFDCGRAYIV